MASFAQTSQQYLMIGLPPELRIWGLAVYLVQNRAVSYSKGVEGVRESSVGGHDWDRFAERRSIL